MCRLIQHSLNIMLELYHAGRIELPFIVEKMCHAPAKCFRIKERGYLDEGLWADVTVVDLNQQWTVNKENILYKCNWSPFEGGAFKGRVQATVVSGHLAYLDGQFFEKRMGERLQFGE